MYDRIPSELREVIPGALGSALALKWIPGPWWWRATAFLCGALTSYIAAVPVAEWLALNEKWVGVLGLLLGLISISVISKVLATIDAVQPTEVWAAILAWIRKRLGV